MRPLERKLLKFSACAFILLVVAAIFMPVFACGCSKRSPAYACLSNTRRLALGLVMYADDHDERFAMRDVWLDGIQPYVKAEFAFHDPEVPRGVYGYAFNAALSVSKTPPHPEKVPMVYDSVNPIRNASDRLTSLPNPGRHKGRNSLGYADGHAKLVKAP